MLTIAEVAIRSNAIESLTALAAEALAREQSRYPSAKLSLSRFEYLNSDGHIGALLSVDFNGSRRDEYFSFARPLYVCRNSSAQELLDKQRLWMNAAISREVGLVIESIQQHDAYLGLGSYQEAA